MGSSDGTLLLRTLCSVLGAALLTVGDALGIQRSANDVVTDTGQVTNTASADQNDRVLLQVVSDTGNVAGSFHSVGQTDSRDLTKSRVRLLRRHGRNLGANASLLRGAQVGLGVAQGVKAKKG